MTLRAKWIVCGLLVVCMLGTSAWLARIVPEDRPSRLLKPISTHGQFRSFNVPESRESDMLPLNYRPREYVKIIGRDR